MRKPLGLVIAGAIVASGVALVSMPDRASAGPGDGTLSVRVIRDINGNGSYEPALEVGVEGIPVTVTDPSGATAAGTTGPDGTVAVNLGSVTGGAYRVEASIPGSMSYLKPAPAGNGLSSLTEFVNVAAGQNAMVTMGVWNPADYCQANPKVASACQRSALLPPDANARSVITFPYDRTGTSPAPDVEAQQSQTGTVMGMAYQRHRKVIFSAAFAKRLAQYGPGGSGGIYVTDPAANTTSLWATVPNAGGTAHQIGANQDGVFFPATGKESLGDIELSEDDSRLFVINMSDRKLYTFDATKQTGGAPLSSVAIPSPGCPSAGDWRPGALGVRDGAVYVGGVCSGQSTNKRTDVRAVVYRFDPAAGTFSAPIVSKVLDFQRGRVKYGDPEPMFWQPWTDQWSLGLFNPVNDTPLHLSYPSPLMTDIVIEANGDLVLGFRDRFSDQAGNNAMPPDGSSRNVYVGVSGGDINRACKQPNGTFAWEGAAANCPDHQTPANSGDELDSVVEFYPGEFFRLHHETAQGGLALNYSSPNILTTAMDPVDSFRTDGTKLLSRTDGTAQGGYQILTESSEGFAKAQGLADLELLCDLAPVQIGNRVWFDTDSDGIQDGNEPPIAGVRITATPCDGGTPLPAKTTNAKGEYYFGTADGLKPDTCYNLKFDYSGVNPATLPGSPPVDRLRWTTKEAGGNRAVDSNVDSAGAATVTVGHAGSVDHTIDAGLVAGPADALGDYVWFDANRNGVQDAGEPGVPGAVAILKNGNGTELGRRTTDASGKYLFDKLPDGTYQVCFDLSALPAPYTGYALTRANAGGDDGKDSDADPASGCTATTTLGADKREDLTLDAGIRPPDRLGDFVWIDKNKNGLQDGGEPGVPGVTVTVKKPDGTVAGTTTTDAAGKYLFDKLPDGTYTVCFGMATLPAAVADYQLTKPNAGDDAADSDADPASGCTEPVTLNVDKPENLTLDAGLVPPANQLGDFVWIDKNKNGLQDAGEPGVPGVTAILKDDKGTQVATTKTDPNGKYLFDELPDGTYQVCFELKALPAAVADYTVTTANAGDDTKDSDADPATGCTPATTLGTGKRENLTLDLGLVAPPNRLGDFVWVDTNRNGLQDGGEPGVSGVTVVLKDDKGTQVATTKTDPNGKYLFDKLPDGTYTVCFDLKALPAQYAGYLPTRPDAGADDRDSDANPATGCTEPVSLGVGKRENLTLDAGIRTPDRLGDLVWVDTNRNGLQDGGEPGVSGVTVVLKDDKGAQVATTKTDPNGKYLFDKLPDGTYTVCFDRATLPAQYIDYQLTKPNVGADGVDSDADPATWCTPPTTLSADHPEDLTLDAGIVQPRNRIGDYVWLDRNGNGLQDSDEPPAGGVPMILKDAAGKEVSRTTTDAAGKYLFDDLPDGTYQVCVDTAHLPTTLAGYRLTKANNGDDAVNSDADPATGCTRQVTVGPRQREILVLDAGLIAPPAAMASLATTGENLYWLIMLALLAIASGTVLTIAIRHRRAGRAPNLG